MRFSDFASISILALVASATPLVTRDATADKNKKEITEFFARRNAALKVLKTTVTSEGQTIDWIPRESQGDIASPPPNLTPTEGDPSQPEQHVGFELENSERGPAGTVPVLRPNLGDIDYSRTSLQDLLGKSGIPQGQTGNQKRSLTSPHRYASSDQLVVNYGGQGQFSVWNPEFEYHDFSLMQLAISRDKGALIPGTTQKRTEQSVEAGWMVQGDRYHDLKTHLFTFYNTNGYDGFGDNIGGWNQEIKGWVQVDDTIFPGTVLTPVSTIGGVQKKLWIAVTLFNGKWWVWAKDRWIGYYPAILFIDGKPDTLSTLGVKADHINFYGEILDDDGEGFSSVTTTDMGSGKFSGTHWQNAAYIHNLLYQIDYDRSKGNGFYKGNILVTDSSKWDFEEHFANRGSWGSYCWLGGPGRRG